MKTHPRILGVSAFMLVLLALVSCESPDAPSMNDGRIVLHFEPASQASALVAGSAAPTDFDSVVVNIFRPGDTPNLEVSKGASIGGVVVDVNVGCVAENGKKVGVDLYEKGVLTYHGFDGDVDVVANQTTPVAIDAYAFYVSGLALTPTVIPNGAAFTLHWPPAAAATKYRLEESATPNFATITSSQTAVDTTIDIHVGPGSHYFRVRPTTTYATGNATPPKFGYVSGGGNHVTIKAVDDAVIPGETITITGENLDFPGTQATIGAVPLTIESVTWGQIIARVPRNAITEKVTVTSSLGTDEWGQKVVVQRVAYVSADGEFAAEYIALLATKSVDFGLSGVVSLPIEELDTRDMTVFDIIIVGPDTGTQRTNWGAGRPNRAAAIENSNANVIAMGKGGAVFLSLVTNAASVPTTTAVDADKAYFEADKDDALFHTPHGVGGPDLPFCKAPAISVSMAIPGPYPTAVNLYASTGKTGFLGIYSPNDEWALADFRFNDPDGTPVVYFFWGFAANPQTTLTSQGSDCLFNIMNMLYKSAPAD